MAALSDYAENLLLNFLMTGTGSSPSSLHLALFTAAPSDSGGGTEVSASGYARQAVTWTTATGTGGTCSNSNAPSFTASADFGTVTHIGIFDSNTSGNLLWHGAMSASKTVNSGDTLQFSIGNIDLTIG